MPVNVENSSKNVENGGGNVENKAPDVEHLASVGGAFSCMVEMAGQARHDEYDSLPIRSLWVKSGVV